MVRRAAEVSVLVLIAGIAVRAWLVEGLIAPLRISSGSMAESVLGPHVSVRCADCGLVFACDAIDLPEPFRAVCPQCGCASDSVQPLVRQPGDRLVVDKLTYAVRAPRRWEAVVFRCPERPSEYCIKRVVGLPGEIVSLRDGDVWIDGRLAHKSLDELANLAVPVFDARFKPQRSRQRPRWRELVKRSAWVETDAGFRLPLASGANDSDRNGRPAKDWLWYCHRTNRSDGTAADGPVTDNYAFNQSLSRQLNQVRDLLLVADIKAHGDGLLSLMATYAGEDFMIEMVPSGGLGQLYRLGKPQLEFHMPQNLFDRPSTLRLALVDNRILLEIDGRILIEYEVDPRPAAALDRPMPSMQSSAARPMGIGAAGLAVEITNLRLLRDVFYTDLAPGQSARAETWRLGPDEFFVLGDNSPISRDSRLGPSEFVPVTFILGKPLIWP